MAAFSQYIVYADESGSPVLGADTYDYPIFVLVFLLINKRHYAFDVVPKVQMLKFDFVGHDQLILHERDLRTGSKAFAFLQVPENRSSFLHRISAIVAETDVEVCATVIDKTKWTRHHADIWEPYERAAGLCIFATAEALLRKGETDTEVTIVFESRGKKEDQLLELDIHRMSRGERFVDPTSPAAGFSFRPLFVDKKSNSTGLQLADLFARPLGLAYLRPEKSNRAVDVLNAKLTQGGVRCFP